MRDAQELNNDGDILKARWGDVVGRPAEGHSEMRSPPGGAVFIDRPGPPVHLGEEGGGAGRLREAEFDAREVEGSLSIRSRFESTLHRKHREQQRG